jgi:hypothetical protein
MGELLVMFLTGGGSTAMGAMLKGVFGYIFEAKRQKYELELARESRANDNFVKLQTELHKGGNAEFVSFTRRGLAWLGVSGLVFCICVCTPGLKPKYSRSVTPLEKGEPNGYSDSSPILPRKNQSLFLLDTSPLWEISPSFPVFWGSISAPVQEDE